MDWMDLLAVQGSLKSLLQHHSSKASVLWHSAFFIIQLSHPYMTTAKTTAFTIWTFVGKIRFLLFCMLSWLVITFLPRSKRLLISWLQSPSAMILEYLKNSLSLFPLFPLFPHLGRYIFKFAFSNFTGKFAYVYILHELVPIFTISLFCMYIF